MSRFFTHAGRAVISLGSKETRGKITLDGQTAYLFKVFQIRNGWMVETHRTEDGNWGEDLTQVFVPEEDTHRLAEIMTGLMTEIAVKKALKK